MPSTTPQNKAVTFINTFTVKPERQQELIDLLDRATDEVMRHLPGFISATMHRGLEGNKVANYAQWRSLDDFQAVFKDPRAVEHMQEIMKLCEKFEPVLYTVETCHEAEASS